MTLTEPLKKKTSKANLRLRGSTSNVETVPNIFPHISMGHSVAFNTELA